MSDTQSTTQTVATRAPGRLVDGLVGTAFCHRASMGWSCHGRISAEAGAREVALGGLDELRDKIAAHVG
jgi:hypothetical protein